MAGKPFGRGLSPPAEEPRSSAKNAHDNASLWPCVGAAAERASSTRPTPLAGDSLPTRRNPARRNLARRTLARARLSRNGSGRAKNRERQGSASTVPGPDAQALAPRPLSFASTPGDEPSGARPNLPLTCFYRSDMLPKRGLAPRGVASARLSVCSLDLAPGLAEARLSR